MLVEVSVDTVVSIYVLFVEGFVDVLEVSDIEEYEVFSI